MTKISKISFSEWYKKKYNHFDLKIHILMWLCYGFIWIPYLYYNETNKNNNDKNHTKYKFLHWHKQTWNRGIVGKIEIIFIYCFLLAIFISISHDQSNLNKVNMSANIPNIEQAAIRCKNTAINISKWGADEDWGLKYSYKVFSPNRIAIVGYDVKFKNGFGSERYAPYSGVYYVDKNTCVLQGIDLDLSKTGTDPAPWHSGNK